MTAIVRWSAVGFLLLAALPAAAQVAYPPPPEKYDVHIRYRIRTDRDERIRQFRALQAHLKELGYDPVRRADDDLDIFNPDAEMTNGTLPAAGVAKLFDATTIRTAVIAPAGKGLLADPKVVAQVRIRIAGGYTLLDQRKLHEQIVTRLGRLGFKEAVGYDHQKFLTVRGAMPAGEVLGLLKDLRTLPAGYFFGPDSEPQQPLASVLPIRLVEVLPPLESSTVTDNDPKAFTADLAALLADPAAAERPLMVEVLFDPDVLDVVAARNRFKTAGTSITLNGTVGLVATLRLSKAKSALEVARIPGVTRLRLPRAANETVAPVAADPKASDFLVESRTVLLHQLGYTGAGAKVVVVGSSFDGWEKLAGKGLPKDVKYLDLTAETDLAVRPLPLETGRVSGGLPAAVAAHRAAPGAALHLVRIDPAQMHQLLTVLRAVAGDASVSVAQAARVDEASVKTQQLRAVRQRVNEEYRKAFDNLSDAQEAVDARKAALAKIRERQAEEAEANAVVARYLALRAGVEALNGAAVVANTLVWEAGVPHDGLNDIGRDFEARLHARAGVPALKAAKLPPPVGWVQAAGISTGQAWVGAWVDRDGNGVMEFDPTDAKPRPGQWTKELNLLGYQPLGGKATDALPAGLKVRVTVQWREPHDPNGFPPDGSIFPMRLRVLRQADPTGKTHATDDLIEVGRAQGEPVRLARTRGSETFEHNVDVTLPVAGVYGVRLEGAPRFERLALGLTRNLEPRIRVFVELLDAGERAKGKVLFRSYADDAAGVGVPGDSAGVLTVGTPADGAVKSLTALGPGVTLGAKPDVTTAATVTVDGKTFGGTAVGAGYAGGLFGALAELSVRPTDLVRTFELKPGTPLVLPAEWLSTVTPREFKAKER